MLKEQTRTLNERIDEFSIMFAIEEVKKSPDLRKFQKAKNEDEIKYVYGPTITYADVVVLVVGMCKRRANSRTHTHLPHTSHIRTCNFSLSILHILTLPKMHTCSFLDNCAMLGRKQLQFALCIFS